MHRQSWSLLTHISSSCPVFISTEFPAFDTHHLTGAALPQALSDRAVFATLAACAAVGSILEERTTLGKRVRRGPCRRPRQGTRASRPRKVNGIHLPDAERALPLVRLLSFQVSAPLLALFAAAALSSSGILPASSAAYDAVWGVLLPPGVALLMLQADLRRLLSSSRASILVRHGALRKSISLLRDPLCRSAAENPAALIQWPRALAQAFACGAVGTLVGTFVAFYLVGTTIGPSGWQLAACLCASYIGGRHA